MQNSESTWKSTPVTYYSGCHDTYITSYGAREQRCFFKHRLVGQACRVPLTISLDRETAYWTSAFWRFFRHSCTLGNFQSFYQSRPHLSNALQTTVMSSQNSLFGMKTCCSITSRHSMRVKSSKRIVETLYTKFEQKSHRIEVSELENEVLYSS